MAAEVSEKCASALRGAAKVAAFASSFFWLSADDEIYMLLIDPKSKKDTLSADEVAVLRALVKEF